MVRISNFFVTGGGGIRHLHNEDMRPCSHSDDHGRCRKKARTPISIVDGKLENCASKVAQIRLSRRAELVSPVRQQALLHSRACPTGSC